jgi:hypothetical protein
MLNPVVNTTLSLAYDAKPKMTPLEFCYWLQGFMEISDPKTVDVVQTEIIREHLGLVFNKETRNF